ncbi:MAG: HipA N-terminal domain-containing protein [Planctomycetes bacterium]|nr:HipA N-terminal domain-containing protein [Planctomycetota bacterium]
MSHEHGADSPAARATVLLRPDARTRMQRRIRFGVSLRRQLVIESGPAWLARVDARAISLTLPLRSEPYASSGRRPFFAGLLPKGWLFDISTRRSSSRPTTASGCCSRCAATASAPCTSNRSRAVVERCAIRLAALDDEASATRGVHAMCARVLESAPAA